MIPNRPIHTTAALKGAVATMGERERAAALDCFLHWERECKRIRYEGPAENVAYTLHLVVDERMAALASTANGRKIRCAKGCPSCCHLSVDITPQEAVLLRRLAREDGIAIDEERLKRQAAAAGADGWKALPHAERACVFLGDDGACRVYEHRPGACRKYSVMSDPEQCDANKHPGAEVTVVFDVVAELISSASMTVYGADRMATMLLANTPE